MGSYSASDVVTIQIGQGMTQSKHDLTLS